MLPVLGSLISAGTSLIGGKMASDATQAANARAQANFEQQQRTADAQRDQDYQRQEHFARHGVQWRAEDALKAGIHPLYALGGNFATYSGSPVTVGAPSVTPDTSMGSAVASMGQDIGRAINATRTGQQREDAFTKTVQDLTLQKMGLENTLLASQIKRLQVNDNPPFPSATSSQNNPTTANLFPPAKAEALTRIAIGNREFDLDPTTSPAEATENTLGEESILGRIINELKNMRHVQHHLRKNTTVQYSKPTSWRDWLPSFSWTNPPVKAGPR